MTPLGVLVCCRLHKTFPRILQHACGHWRWSLGCIQEGLKRFGWVSMGFSGTSTLRIGPIEPRGCKIHVAETLQKTLHVSESVLIYTYTKFQGRGSITSSRRLIEVSKSVNVVVACAMWAFSDIQAHQTSQSYSPFGTGSPKHTTVTIALRLSRSTKEGRVRWKMQLQTCCFRGADPPCLRHTLLGCRSSAPKDK